MKLTIGKCLMILDPQKRHVMSNRNVLPKMLFCCRCFILVTLSLGPFFSWKDLVLGLIRFIFLGGRDLLDRRSGPTFVLVKDSSSSISKP